jgi:hypothetical protein
MTNFRQSARPRRPLLARLQDPRAESLRHQLLVMRVIGHVVLDRFQLSGNGWGQVPTRRRVASRFYLTTTMKNRQANVLR